MRWLQDPTQTIFYDTGWSETSKHNGVINIKIILSINKFTSNWILRMSVFVEYVSLTTVFHINCYSLFYYPPVKSILIRKLATEISFQEIVFWNSVSYIFERKNVMLFITEIFFSDSFHFILSRLFLLWFVRNFH